VHTHSDPYGLVTPIVKLVRDMSADQPIEKPATLEDIRAEVLTPDRLNSIVFGGFAIVALAIAVVGVSGVLAFSVSARTREFGIRLAVGSPPSRLLTGVIREGTIMAAAGIAAGVVFGFGLARLAGRLLLDMKLPTLLPVAASALILLIAAIAASALPALRASRVDVIQALRSE
jgi:ABC-type antimicrobial peptide transport system permease subunit